MAPQPSGSFRIPVLYEDHHVIAIVKPSGIPSQEDETGDPDVLTLVKADLKVRYAKPGNVFLGLVHRLDRPVGGVMLLAKTSKAASRLSESVRSRSFAKSYLAVTDGVPRAQAGSLRHYLRKDARTNTVTAFAEPAPDAKEALLDYRTAAASGGRALVAVRLHTGRPHQIRVQLAAIGCPLAGDRKYGERREAGKAGADIALWSAYVGARHPVTKEWLSLRALPDRQGFWKLWSPEQLALAGGVFTGERHDV